MINPNTGVTEKIQAIKAVREFCMATFGFNLGLKEAKNFVEEHICPNVVNHKRFKVGDRFSKDHSCIKTLKSGAYVVIEVKEANLNTGHPQELKIVHVRTGDIHNISGWWVGRGLEIIP